MERRNNVDKHFARLVFRTPLHKTVIFIKKYRQIDKETNRSVKTFINDDWRLRNDLPYKAVKPTWIKLQNHLSKLNVTHTRAANTFYGIQGKSGESKGTFCDNQSLIFITSFAEARNWWVNLFFSPQKSFLVCEEKYI